MGPLHAKFEQTWENHNLGGFRRACAAFDYVSQAPTGNVPQTAHASTVFFMFNYIFITIR